MESKEETKDKMINDKWSVILPRDHKNDLDQDEEFMTLKSGEEERRLRFHDYDKIYEIPGLYEYVFYEELECCSPDTISGLLNTVIKRKNINPKELRDLDVGAGNGMAAEALQEQLGIAQHLGIDINPEAKMAAERDRAGIYQDYLAADLTDLSEEEKNRIREFSPNLMLCVAALGFGDIPGLAFVNGYNLVENGGLIAFNIRDVFLDKSNFYLVRP
ncbi:MAG: methyltransferase domain-containing protein [Fimbriimonadaceae bacterium]